VLTLAVSVYMQQGPKIVVVSWAFKNIVSKIRQWKSRRRTTITTNGFNRKKILVFKDGFEKVRAAQRMNISSVKIAAHFDHFDGKSFELNFLVNKESYD